MDTPVWALSFAYWLHMLATVLWIGGLTALALVVLPAASSALDSAAFASLLAKIQSRLDPLSWFSLALLTGTGMFQMSANPNYAGFLSIDSSWAMAILIKHLLFIGMIAISAYLTWGVMPRIRRMALLRARNALDETTANRLLRQETFLLRANLILGVLILALTAVARAS